DERLLVLARDNDRRGGLPPRLEKLGGLLGRRRIERVAGDEPESAGLGVIAQRGAERGARSLAAHLEREVAGGRREGWRAARAPRGADRALAGAPSALLAPGLRAAAGHEATALRSTRSLPARVQLRSHRFVHEVRLDLGGEDGLVERDLLLGAAED